MSTHRLCLAFILMLSMTACESSEWELSSEPVSTKPVSTEHTSQQLSTLQPRVIAAISGDNQATAGVLSPDGERFYQAQGHQIVAFDAEAVRSERDGSEPVDFDSLIIDAVPLTATVMDMKIHNDVIWVAGGDYGLFRLPARYELSTPERVAYQRSGRWAIDLEVVESDLRSYVLVLWAGHDNNALSIHAMDGQQLAILPLSVQTGLAAPTRAWAIATHEQYAFVAAGTAGVVRLNWMRLLTDGHVSIEAGPLASRQTDPKVAEFESVRDIAADKNGVYVAANAQGLVKLMHSQPWSPEMPQFLYFGGQPIVKQYPLRVTTHLDLNGVSRVFVGAGKEPSALLEWGPYAAYGNFAWHTLQLYPGVGVLDDENTSYRNSGTNRLYVFETHSPEVGLSLVSQAIADYDFENGQRFGTLSPFADGDDFELFTQAPVHWKLSLSDGHLSHSASARFVTALGGYATGTQSRIDSDIILAGHDAGSHQIFRFDESGRQFEAVWTGSDHGTKLGLWVTDSFTTSRSTEWTIGGGAGENWLLARIEHQRAGLRVTQWSIPVGLEIGNNGARDAFGYDPRSYSTSAIDHETGIVALARSQAKEGIVITHLDALVSAAAQSTDNGADSGTFPPILPEILHTMVLHHEAPNDGTTWNTGPDHLYSFMPKFFRNAAGRKTLAVPAGYFVDSNSPHYRRPKIVFFDFENYEPGEPIAHTYAVGSMGPGNAVDVDFFSHGGRQYMVVADTGGAASLHDINALPHVLAGSVNRGRLDAVDEWQMPSTTFDGETTMCSGVQIRHVPNAQSPQAWLACNRAGVFILEFAENGRRLELRDTGAQRVNTPFQALTLAPFSGKEGLWTMGFDHGGGIFMLPPLTPRTATPAPLGR
ncbi:MAG: hypothetical protein ACON3Z_01040 [Bradymonadia bacterium]